MESHFHRELDKLKMTLIQMAALSERAMVTACQAFFARDVDLAEEVIQNDREINLLEVEIDKQSLKLLALDQPMARDLRFIVAGLRIAVDLERVADQAVNIAQRVRFLGSRPPLPRDPVMEQLSEASLDMLKLAISAFVNQDANQAMDVCTMDDKVDELNVMVLKNLIDYMMNEVPAVERSVQTIIVARCMERTADHATNIAESVTFIVRGLNIKHHSST
ncbi:MAG: phosphate signaling complex protein PhoU [Syntrophobacteraceae bacterium]